MTHRRAPQTVEASLSRALPRLSDSELQHFTGKSRDYFRKCANPMQRHNLAFDDAVALDRALISRGLPPAFLALFERRLREGAMMAEPHRSPPEAVASLFLQVARLQAAAGDLARTVIGLGESLLRGEKRAPRASQTDARLKAEACTEAVLGVVDAVERIEGAAASGTSGAKAK